jgi:acetyl esterase/lipase
MKFIMKSKYVFLPFVLALFLVSCPTDEDQKPQIVSTPTATPTAGAYNATQNVTLNTTTTGASIRYTTNGSTPTENSTLYNNPIQIAATTTIKAIGIKSGMTNSELFTATYTINLPAAYTVNTIANPMAGGTITRNPDQANYTQGTQVTVTATENSGYAFTNWTGTPVDAVPSGNTIIFTVNSHITQLTANFQQQQSTYTLIVNAGTGGTVSPSGTSTRNANESVSVTATPNSGYAFSSWTGAPVGVNASSSSITFNITSNVNLTANFQGEGTTPIVRERLNVDYAPTATRRHNRQRYDLKLPNTGEGPFPLLIYVHGGGFSGGNWQLNQNNNGLVSLASTRGYAVASVGYLLMGQSGWSGGQRAFPENVEDVLAAVRHLRANAGEYRLDTNRFAISGFSAGAYLTAIVCALSGAEDHGYDVTSLGNAGISHAVQAAASTAALTDFALLNTHQSENAGIFYMLNHDASPEGAMLGGNLKDNTDSMKKYLRMQNPLTHISTITPPIYMLHGANDNMVPWQQSEIVVNKINEFVMGKAVFNKVSGRSHADFDGATNATTIAILNFLDEKLGIQR